jgi:hypothetical protein
VKAIIPKLIALLALTGVAQAQTRVTPCDPATPNNAICVYWTAPATNDDGTPSILPLTYRVERQTHTTPPTWMAVETVNITRSYLKNLTAGTTYYFRVFALAGGKESVPSNTASKLIETPNPGSVVIIIAATIHADGPPTYREIQSVRIKPDEVVFAAPVAMRPLFASR